MKRKREKKNEKREDTWENTVYYFGYHLHNGTSIWILLPDTYLQVFHLSIRENNKSNYLYDVVVWLIISGAKILVATIQSFAFTRSCWKNTECTRHCSCSALGDEE